MRIDIRDSKYSIIYNEKTGTVEDVLWCNESAEDLKNLNRQTHISPSPRCKDYPVDVPGGRDADPRGGVLPLLRAGI
mgnify:CR=1 FL=1